MTPKSITDADAARLKEIFQQMECLAREANGILARIDTRQWQDGQTGQLPYALNVLGSLARGVLQNQLTGL
jgi:hypothetical protein